MLAHPLLLLLLPLLLFVPWCPCADPRQRVCAITGKHAQYRDPLTGHYYADKAAFKALRARHAAHEATGKAPPRPHPPPMMTMMAGAAAL